MAAEVSPQPDPPQPRFSRYRSIRRGQQTTTPPPPPPPPLPPTTDHPPVPEMPSTDAPTSTIARSMSRYHRQRPANLQRHAPAPPAPAVPPVPSIPAAHATRSSTVPLPSAPQHSSHLENAITADPSSTSPPLYSPRPRQVSGPTPGQISPDDARNILEDEQERQRTMRAKLKEEQRAKLEEKERAIREQREAERADRLRAQKEAAERERLEQIRLQEEDDRRQQEAERTARSRERSHRDHDKPSRVREESRGGRRLRKERPQALEVQPDMPSSSESVSPRESRTDRPGFSRKHTADEHPRTATMTRTDTRDTRNGTTSRTATMTNTPGTRSRQVSGGHEQELNIKPGGGGAVPGIDAPISAVNAGDRRVLVECNHSSIMLPVTPSTTALDLIRSASTCLSEPIDPKTSVLLENFYKCSVQRPLRKYEHVRDVMNSWDDDSQNSLIILPSPDGGFDSELSAANVPTTRPGEFSCWMYHSSKPGKWSKRFITLRADGQMVMAKSETAKEKDISNVCHISDFDIYNPTSKKLAKNVKPPKKICYAIKSQQKSTMFIDTSTYIHFFCTSDPAIATRFYKAVQGWRSWYLTNVLGEGKKKAAETTKVVSASNHAKPTHRHTQSLESHYELGSFKPLIDLDDMDFSNGPQGRKQSLPDTTANRNDTAAMHRRKMSIREQKQSKYPPISFPTSRFQDGEVQEPPKSTNNSRLNSLTRAPTNEAEEFNPNSLLGRTYLERQKAQQEREKQQAAAQPFTSEGPTLLSTVGNARPTSRDGPNATLANNLRRSNSANHHSIARSHDPSAGPRTSGELRRSATTRQKPKPLVDLTPQYREPPQHLRKGKGYHPETIPAGGLIEAATTPDAPFYIPPSTDWRRPTISGARGGPPAGGMAALHTAPNPYAAEASVDAFTGRGLLAGTGFSQGGVATGHGVMDGTKAKGPMLDMSEKSKFVPGSLLAVHEKEMGPQGPIIDREKRNETDIATGEGY